MTPIDVLRIIAPLLQLAICVLLILSIVASRTMRKSMDASRKALEETISIWNELYERSLAGAAMQTAPEAPDYDDIDMPHVDYLRLLHDEARERNKALITDWESRNDDGKAL